MDSLNKRKSALSVSQGVAQPPSVNPMLGKEAKHRTKKHSVSEYVDGILAGNINILSQAITLVESNLQSTQEIGHDIVGKCLPHSTKSIRIGITGAPGAGKSSFIETFGKTITDQGKRLAVLAIDPSSGRTKGSILGDKTRMSNLATNPSAFIRPSPSSGSLGGIARKTRETIILCEAAGFDTIIVETVGVGQSETTIHSMVDFFLLLMLAGSGDELQGIKRGIMEMADLIAITKADGDNESRALVAMGQFQNALGLFPPTPSGWKPIVRICSSHTNTGIETIWQDIQQYLCAVQASGYFSQNRQNQAKHWMHQTIEENLKANFYNNRQIIEAIRTLEEDVLAKRTTPFAAAQKVMRLYLEGDNK